MSSKQQVTEATITATVDGRVYEGTQIVRGVRVRFQTIRFQDREKSDNQPYKPHETAKMNSFAVAILRELVLFPLT